MSRPPATSRKVGRVLVLPALLALFLVCLRAPQTARALLGAGAVPFPRSVPPRIWARNLLVARRAEAEGNEDDKGPLEPRDSKSKAPKEKDDVEEAEATASFDQVSRNKAVDEAASAQTADPVEDAKQDEQLQQTVQETEEIKEDKGFDESTEKVTNAQKFLALALARWEGIEKDLTLVSEKWREAIQRGDEEEERKWEQERKEAKEEFDKAKAEAEKAKEELEKAQSSQSTAPLQAGGAFALLRVQFVRSTIVAFWGHALLSARIPSSLSFTVLACSPAGSGRGSWLLQVQANLVALCVLPMLHNGVSVLGSRWGGQPVLRSLCARSPSCGCFCLRLDFHVTVSVRGGVKGVNLGSSCLPLARAP
ncbi:unnamed protein product [Symbiodinium sp. CCMP2592]|nr:unnamed protein product [Symbiodinium sp. CCMP2592]